MSKEDDVTGGASEEELNQAYKESQDAQDPNTLEKELQKLKEGKKEKRREQFKKRNTRTRTDTEGNTLTNSPGQVFKGGEQITGTTPPDTDMRTGEMIPNDAEEDEFGNPKFAQSIAFETGLNIALDKLTTPLLGAPIPFARVAYGISNAGLSAIINYYAQRIRGTEFSLGELVTASGLSLVPGGVNAKTLQGSIAKAARKGAATGATAVTSESLIDTGEFADIETLAAGTLFGGVAGGTFQTTADFIEDVPTILKALRQRADGSTFEFAGSVGAAKPRKLTKKERLALERQGQGNIFKSFAADPRLGQTDDQIMDAYKAYRGRIGDPYVDPKKAFKRGLVTRKLKVTDFDPILKEHPEIPKDKVNEYIQLVNDESKNKSNRLGQTITFLNDAYINGKLGVKKLGNLTVEDLTPNKVRTGSPQEIAEDLSAMLNQNITVKTLDNIIQEKVSIPVKISDKVVMQVTDLKSLTKAYMARINRFTGIPAVERGHVYAAKNIFDDPNITSLSDYKGSLEPEIARSTYNEVDDQSFDDLLKGVDLEQVLVGNRSRADKSDPDKVVARLLGTDYGLRESFLNFVYPQRALANKIPADAKAAFIDDYVEEMNLALQDYEGAQIGVNTLDFIRAAVLKKIIPKYEALDDTLIEGLITTTNMVTGRDMVSEVNEALTKNLVNPQEIRRKGEAK